MYMYLYYYEARFMEMFTQKTTVQPRSSTTPDLLLMNSIPRIMMGTKKKATKWTESKLSKNLRIKTEPGEPEWW